LWEVVSAPATWLALVVVALGLIAWWQRKQLELISEPLRDLARVAEKSFGFEAINQSVVQTVQTAAEELRGMQTGILNWNVLGIVAALVAVLLILAMGA
jgi:NADH-quinone oxidoreductase subunit L